MDTRLGILEFQASNLILSPINFRNSYRPRGNFNFNLSSYFSYLPPGQGSPYPEALFSNGVTLRIIGQAGLANPPAQCVPLRGNL